MIEVGFFIVIIIILIILRILLLIFKQPIDKTYLNNFLPEMKEFNPEWR